MKDRFIFLSIIIILISAWGVSLVSDELTFSMLCKEDGLVEWLQAIFFLISSFFFFAAFIIQARRYNSVQNKIKNNIFYLLLAAVTFFGFGEEINWGERILNLKMPAFLEKANVHHLSAHNLDVFMNNLNKAGIQRFLTLAGLGVFFSIVWFVFLPIINHISRRFSAILKRINLPIVPFWITFLFLINLVVIKTIQFYFYNPLTKSFTELREYIQCAFFLAASVYFFLGAKQKTDHD